MKTRLHVKWTQAYGICRFFLITTVSVCFILSTLMLARAIRGTNSNDFEYIEEEVPAEELINFKVPGVDTFCPEFRKNSGFTERITFIETSGEVCMTPRSLCGVESASRANPDMTIYVYFNTKKPKAQKHYISKKPGKIRSCNVTTVLKTLPNVKVIHEDLFEVLRDTKFWTLVEKGLFELSDWSYVHLSDAVRLSLLKKYGGFYLDFDTITFRPLHCLRNSMSYLEDVPHLENEVMVFDKNHPFLSFVPKYLVQVFEPTDRMTIGPPAMARAFKIYCGEANITTGNFTCYNGNPINLVHPDSFYPIKHNKWYHYYNRTFTPSVVQAMERSYLAHIYASGWGNYVPQTSLYASLARNYCPTVWELTKLNKIKFGF